MTVGYRHNRDRQTLHYIFFQRHRCFLAAREKPDRPVWREPAHPPRGTYPWQAADVVAGVSALRYGNPICRCGSSKGLTFNPFTLAGEVDYCGRQNDPEQRNGT
jgi:hypothetical protein